MINFKDIQEFEEIKNIALHAPSMPDTYRREMTGRNTEIEMEIRWAFEYAEEFLKFSKEISSRLKPLKVLKPLESDTNWNP